jgi:TolA-binding protein
MALPWLTALKVIPWGDVIEHAPKVLNAARQLLDRQRQRGRGAEPVAPATVPVEPVGSVDLQALQSLQHQLAAARDDLERLRQTQEALTQTVADLAEQNSRLVAAVELLRRRTRLLMGAVLLLAVAGLWWSQR